MMIVTIDGPAGTGKTTVARRVAERLGFLYFDTGALYRAFTYKLLAKKLALSDREAMAQLCKTIDFESVTEGDKRRYFVDGEEVTESIRSAEVTRQTSIVAADPLVREALLERQRQWGAVQDAVFEGRDMGTVVFPEAQVKIFLTASPEVRAERRYLERTDHSMTRDQLLQAIEVRDRQDATRAVAPLKPAADAHIIDTSFLTLDEVVALIVRLIRS